MTRWRWQPMLCEAHYGSFGRRVRCLIEPMRGASGEYWRATISLYANGVWFDGRTFSPRRKVRMPVDQARKWAGQRAIDLADEMRSL